MSERKGVSPFWIVFAVVVGVVLGWWLKAKAMAVQLAGQPKPKVPLEERAGDYLTVKELKAYLPVCEKTLRREINEGKLPSIRMRGKVTVQVSDFLAWLSARREGGFNAENA